MWSIMVGVFELYCIAGPYGLNKEENLVQQNLFWYKMEQLKQANRRMVALRHTIQKCINGSTSGSTLQYDPLPTFLYNVI